MDEAKLTDDQRRKLRDIPKRWRAMYIRAVTTKDRRAMTKLHCTECMGWVQSEVEGCTARACVCYPYRLGGWPGRVEGAPENDDEPTEGVEFNGQESPIPSSDGSQPDPTPERRFPAQEAG